MIAIENKKVKNENVDKGLVISFFDINYLEEFDYNHDNPMVITTIVHNYIVKRVLID